MSTLEVFRIDGSRRCPGNILNTLLDAEADPLCNSQSDPKDGQRYRSFGGRLETRDYQTLPTELVVS